jgi:hypothetical protein
MSLPFMQPYMGLGNSLQTAQGGAAGGIGGWVELGRTTLGSGNANISVSSLADKRYYMLLCDNTTSATNGDHSYRFNGDTGSNYSSRYNFNGGSDGTFTTYTKININGGVTGEPNWNVAYVSNLAAKEKLLQSWVIQQAGTGASNIGTRADNVGKWTNTSDAIDQIDAVVTNAGTYNTGSELVVLGWDPADTHTTNFWEELASVDLSGGAATTLSTGTFTAKKYLWWQIFQEIDTTQVPQLQMNGDTGSNYAGRYSNDGGSDGTDVNQTFHNLAAFQNQNTFSNGFTINNSANEKLSIVHSMAQSTAGAANAPQRREDVWKWANTSSQITSLDLTRSGSGNFGTKTTIKVWGSD